MALDPQCISQIQWSCIHRDLGGYFLEYVVTLIPTQVEIHGSAWDAFSTLQY